MTINIEELRKLHAATTQGDDRYSVIQQGYWWTVRIGDGEATYGKYHTRSAAENAALLLKREFLNGVFICRVDELLDEIERLRAENCKTPIPISDQVKIIVSKYHLRNGVQHPDGSLGTIEITPRQLREELEAAIRARGDHES